MNLEQYLSKATIVDCQGQVAFELILLLNGDVLVKSQDATFQVNPTTRSVSPSRCNASPEIINQAVIFARSCLG